MEDSASIDLNGPDVDMTEREQSELLDGSEFGDEELQIQIHCEDDFPDEDGNLLQDRVIPLESTSNSPTYDKRAYKRSDVRHVQRKVNSNFVILLPLNT